MLKSIVFFIFRFVPALLIFTSFSCQVFSPPGLFDKLNAYSGSSSSGSSSPAGPAPVNLGTAGNFVILAQSGISTVPTSTITGDMGLSPAADSLITGFSLILDGSGAFSTSPQVTGRVYAANNSPPTPSMMTTAVNDMATAYVDAAGRSAPDFIDIGVSGDISGMTLVPGLYRWSTGVSITTGNVTLDGGPNDVWIFQISGTLSMSTGFTVILSGGARPKNIFWQCTDASLGTSAHLEGIVLSSTTITLLTSASVNGRLLAQTAVSLQANTVTQPAP